MAGGRPARALEGKPLTGANLRQFADLVQGETGMMMGDDKSALIQSRLQRRLVATSLPDFQAYFKYVTSAEGDGELRLMLQALTTNMTRFFREPHHFDDLRSEILPKIQAAIRSGQSFRIWSSACSTGEEPYSIAIEILTRIPDANQHDIKILATDLSEAVVAKARRGVYPESALTTVPAGARDRLFARVPAEPGMYEVDDRLRRLIRFNVLNLMKPWPMRGKFDVIFCRNVMIYFDGPTQERLLERMAAICRPGGTIYIGHSERITGPAVSLFTSQGLTTYRLCETGEKNSVRPGR